MADQNTELMAEVNKLTKRELSADEVYLFDLILCDNQIDRDGDCFSDAALEELRKRFVGVTGIFDHNPKSGNQAARIFRTDLVTDPARKTKTGAPYRYLRANAYTVRTNGNQDLIREIDGGIKKEVSISCAVGKQICSICGANRLQKPCQHVKGRTYAGAKCYHVLDDVNDVYEWSFVAVPAQKGAGVTKTCGTLHHNPDLDCLKAELDQANAMLDQLSEALRKDVIRLCFRDGDHACAKALADASLHMNIDQLLDLQKSLRTGIADVDTASQLTMRKPNEHATYTYQVGGKAEI